MPHRRDRFFSAETSSESKTKSATVGAGEEKMKRRNDRCRLGKVHKLGGDWCNCDLKYQPRNDKQREPLIPMAPAVVLFCVDCSMIYGTVYLLKLHLKCLGVKEMVDL
jgi:hypothetical protein